jgi:hypothetical protein
VLVEQGDHRVGNPIDIELVRVLNQPMIHNHAEASLQLGLIRKANGFHTSPSFLCRQKRIVYRIGNIFQLQNAYIVTGKLTDAQTVTLDEALPLKPVKVRVVVEPLSPVPQRPYPAIMADIRERQRARGHQPPTPEEVDAYLQAERASWEA